MFWLPSFVCFDEDERLCLRQVFECCHAIRPSALINLTNRCWSPLPGCTLRLTGIQADQNCCPLRPHRNGNVCHLLNTVALLRGVGTVTESVLNLPVKNRTFQRDEEESIFMSLSLLCDWSKCVFSVFHCCPWRLYGNAIHTFFPADLFGRF